jgi:GAF domain
VAPARSPGGIGGHETGILRQGISGHGAAGLTAGRYARLLVASPASYSPLLDVVVEAAVDATGARRGWLLAVASLELVVVAASGDDGVSKVGTRGPVDSGWAGFAVASRRPLALAPEDGDARFDRDLVLPARPRPSSLFCVPCRYQGTINGALQLVDKAGGAPFSIDDVELVAWLAEVAGAAIDEAARGIITPPPHPHALGAELRQLAARDPSRYATVAGVVRELLQPG